MQNLEITDKEVLDATRAINSNHRRRHYCQKPATSWCLLQAAVAIAFVVGFAAVYLQTSQSSGSNDGNGGDSSLGLSQPHPADDASSTATTSTACGSKDYYDCQTDRMGHASPLYAGQALCNAQYRFGVTYEGVFLWHDCATDEQQIVYDPTAAAADVDSDSDLGNATTTVSSDVHYFQMTHNGTLELYDDLDGLIWQKVPLVKITFSAACLSRPSLDCPYLHLHKSGDVVLNSINEETNRWSDRKIQRCFDDLFHSV